MSGFGKHGDSFVGIRDSGIATLDSSGEALVLCSFVSADTPIMLSPMTATNRNVSPETIIPGVSFTITSGAGAGDSGARIAWLVIAR